MTKINFKTGEKEMTVREGGVRFIYQELDVQNQFKGTADYKGGIKARSLDSMNGVLRFFARIFGHTMTYKGKLYVVGDSSFRKFAIRNDCSTKKNFDTEKAAKNIFRQYAKIGAAAGFAQMKQKSVLPPTITKEADTITISKNDLEEVFNLIAVKAVDRKRITDQFSVGPKGYVITRKQFLNALDKIEHKLPKNPPDHLSPTMKKISKEILDFLHHKIDATTVATRTNQIFVGGETPSIKPIPKPAPKPTPVIPGGGALVVVPSINIPVIRKGNFGIREVSFSSFPKIKLNIDFSDLRKFVVNQQKKTLTLTMGPQGEKKIVDIAMAMKAIQKKQQPQAPQSMDALKVIAASWVVSGRDVAKPVFDKLSLLDKGQVILLANHHLGPNSELLRNELEYAIGQLVSHFVVANTLGNQKDDIANFLSFLSQVGDTEFKYGDEVITLAGDFFHRVGKYMEAQDNLLKLSSGTGEGHELYIPENREIMLALSTLLAAKEFGLDASQIEADISKDKNITLQNQVKRLEQIRENAIENVKDFLKECSGNTVEERLLELCDAINPRDLIIALQQEPSLRDELLAKLSGIKALEGAAQLLEITSYEIEDSEDQQEIFELVRLTIDPKAIMAPAIARAIGPGLDVHEEGRAGKTTLPKLQEIAHQGDLRAQAKRLAGAHHWKNNSHKQDLRPQEAQELLKRIIGQDDLTKIWSLYDAPSDDLKIQGKPPGHLRDRLGAKYPKVAELKAFLKELAIQAKVPHAEQLGKGLKLPELNTISPALHVLGNSVRLAGAYHWMAEEHGLVLSQYDAERLLDKIFHKNRDSIAKLHDLLGNEKEWKKLSSAENMKHLLGKQAPSADTLRSFLQELAVKAKVPGARNWGKTKDVFRAAIEAPRKEVQLPEIKDLSPYDSILGRARRLAGVYHWVKDIHKKPLQKDDARKLLEMVALGNDWNKLRQALGAAASEMKLGGKTPEALKSRFGEKYPTATELKAFLKELAAQADISLDPEVQLPDLSKWSHHNHPLARGVRLSAAYYWTAQDHKEKLSSHDARRLLGKIFKLDQEKTKESYKELVKEAREFCKLLGNQKEWDKVSPSDSMLKMFGSKCPEAPKLAAFLEKLIAQTTV